MKDMVWNELKVHMEPSERHGLESAKSKYMYGTKTSEKHSLESANSTYRNQVKDMV